MIWKLLIALAVAYAGWWIWRMPVVRQDRFRRPRPSAPSAPSSAPAPAVRLADEAAAARAVLGVGPDADAAQIRAAHRRLIAAVHPDRGGSAELTRTVNAARDTLLKQIGS
ncbi:J domain-containing protein [Sphingomonas sp. CJ99]